MKCYSGGKEAREIRRNKNQKLYALFAISTRKKIGKMTSNVLCLIIVVIWKGMEGRRER